MKPEIILTIEIDTSKVKFFSLPIHVQIEDIEAGRGKIIKE